MYYTAKAEIQVGKVKIHGATEVGIESSVDTIGGTAKITLPRNRMRSDGKTLLAQIATGDRVTIRLGYNGKLKMSSPATSPTSATPRPTTPAYTPTPSNHKEQKNGVAKPLQRRFYEMTFVLCSHTSQKATPIY